MCMELFRQRGGEGHRRVYMKACSTSTATSVWCHRDPQVHVPGGPRKSDDAVYRRNVVDDDQCPVPSVASPRA